MQAIRPTNVGWGRDYSTNENLGIGRQRGYFTNIKMVKDDVGWQTGYSTNTKITKICVGRLRG